jgi:hypothetical protein
MVLGSTVEQPVSTQSTMIITISKTNRPSLLGSLLRCIKYISFSYSSAKNFCRCRFAGMNKYPMTTLAIYGDSYADCTHGHYYEPKVTDAMGWPNLLGAMGYTMHNYSLGGSSLYWSYQQFISTHINYEKIIFIATVPGRWTGTIDIRGVTRTINSYWLAQDLLDNNTQEPISEANRQQLKRISDYYVHVRDMNFELTVHDLMLAQVRRLRPDAIIVPTWVWSSDSRRDNSTLDLQPYTDLFVNSVRWRREPKRTNNGWHTIWKERAMVCHMTPEINQLAAQQMQASLIQGKYVQTLPPTLAHEHSGEYYVMLR